MTMGDMVYVIIGAFVAWVIILQSRISGIGREVERHRHGLRLLQEALNYRTQALQDAIDAGTIGRSDGGTDDGTSGTGRLKNVKH